jgi:hypothetical protein
MMNFWSRQNGRNRKRWQWFSGKRWNPFTRCVSRFWWKLRPGPIGGRWRRFPTDKQAEKKIEELERKKEKKRRVKKKSNQRERKKKKRRRKKEEREEERKGRRSGQEKQREKARKKVVN